MFQHLLVATDGSAHGLLAARLAGRMTKDSGRLTLLHVAHDPALTALAGLDAASTIVTGAASAMRMQRRLENERKGAEILANARQVLSRPDEAATVVETGRPADVILQKLTAEDVSGIVVGSRGFGPFARALLGSVSDAVLRYAAKPVTLARTERLERILVAVDGSDSSRRAARAAGQLARSTGASVVLVNATLIPLAPKGHSKDELIAALRAEAEVAFAAAREELGGIEAVEEVVFDEPAQAILSEATRLDADLVIVGRSGLQPSRLIPIGTVALRVAADAQASVMVVP